MRNTLLITTILASFTSMVASEALVAGKCISKCAKGVEDVQQGDYVGAVTNFLGALKDTADAAQQIATVADEVQQAFQFTGEFTDGQLANMIQELDKLSFRQSGGAAALYTSTVRGQNVKVLSELVDYMIVAFKDGEITPDEEFKLLKKSREASKTLVDTVIVKDIADPNVKSLVEIMHMVSLMAVNAFDPSKPLDQTSFALKQMVADHKTEIVNFVSSIMGQLAPAVKASTLQPYGDVLLSVLNPSYEPILENTEQMTALIEYAKTVERYSAMFHEAAGVAGAAGAGVEMSAVRVELPESATPTPRSPAGAAGGGGSAAGSHDTQFSDNLTAALNLAASLSSLPPNDGKDLPEIALQSGDIANIIRTMDRIIYIHNGGRLGDYERTQIRYPIVNSAAVLIDNIVLSAMDARITPAEGALIAASSLSFTEMMVDKVIAKTADPMVLHNLIEPSQAIARYISGMVGGQGQSFTAFLNDNADVFVRLGVQLIKSAHVDADMRIRLAPWVDGLVPLLDISNPEAAVKAAPYQVQRLLQEATTMAAYSKLF